MRQIVLIAHNLRSCHNVGSLLRTAEGLGVSEVILSGYTPYPILAEHLHDPRLPHEALKLAKKIQKTALGAETSQPWRHISDIEALLIDLRQTGYMIAAVEQAVMSTPLHEFKSPEKIALLIGREVEGIEPEILASMNYILEIPMYGRKESFNVVQAAAMALYHCRFTKL